MHFISTAGEAPGASLREALSRGLAPDGGLYMPSRIPEFSAGELESISESTWPETASAVLGPLLEGSLDPKTLEELRGYLNSYFEKPTRTEISWLVSTFIAIL